MSLYLGTTPIADGASTALLAGKADVDLSNLNAAGTAKIDGQWVYSSLNLATGVTSPTTTPITYDLSSYLPNDGYNYEILLSGSGNTGTTSGNNMYLDVHSDIILNSIRIARTITRTSSSFSTGGNAIIPVGTGRYIVVEEVSTNTGAFTLNLRGYRRIGTNL